jgi:dephospho-CoA kinase
MIRLALTGSIGMGKSTVAKMFARAGIPVFDADLVVHRLQTENAALIAAIGARFPGAVSGGKIDRDALRARVLGDPAELHALEGIIHPAVDAARERFIDDHRTAPALLFDIPLLFETGDLAGFDKVIVVSAPADIQRRRVLSRADMTPQRFDAIMGRQMPDEEKRRRADFVIDTSGDFSTTEQQVGAIIACLGLAQSR